jgi:hypothetical protein
MILERLKPDLDTPEKIREAYSIFSSYLFSNFIFFFVIFLAVYASYRLKSVLGTNSFLIIAILAMILLYISRKLVRGLLKDLSVKTNHTVFYILCIMNILLLGWIVKSVI